MAPEEILSSWDESRRDFLKKVLAGTTFAAPVMVSFSMKGLSPEKVLAGPIGPNQCSNMPTSACCTFAAEITLDIVEFAASISANPVVDPVEVKALLVGQLGRAQAAMAEGLEKGKGDCNNKPARDQFKKAAKELEKFKDLVETLCVGSMVDVLNGQADDLILQITDLMNGNCP